MRQSFWVLGFVPLFTDAQTIERQPIDIIYGNQIIRSEHQVVVSSREEVSVIPVDRSTSTLGPNVVIAADGRVSSYLEENEIAKREQAIYDEVNRRTEEAPFTVLFTGNIPEKIQERRLRMMPEIGVFGDQANPPGDISSDVITPDVGDFSPAGKGILPVRSGSSVNTSEKPESDEERLEQLIGG
ncbi:hypothetical protein MUS1_05415 [Marinomonas ushuaiensis DSM 15871]|uniref:Uncharacterized protein n=1 Tax=Marinomonas ushuaiensis DSM 15871 TaxID=1122207 RepID=X7E440_9GAMM|nr:hypothetical protein [Marinomonas ushuaiensis]ETX09901.1 hypothetical protein MUS1_05415 [Marinomonas ushuaiensis DSM 15871]